MKSTTKNGLTMQEHARRFGLALISIAAEGQTDVSYGDLAKRSEQMFGGPLLTARRAGIPLTILDKWLSMQNAPAIWSLVHVTREDLLSLLVKRHGSVAKARGASLMFDWTTIGEKLAVQNCLDEMKAEAATDTGEDGKKPFGFRVNEAERSALIAVLAAIRGEALDVDKL